MSTASERTRSELAAQIRHEIDRRERQLAALNVVPATDTYEEGAMLRVRVQPDGRNDTLTYLLLKVGGHIGGDPRDGLWYHTGRIYRGGRWQDNEHFRGWEQLQYWALRANVVEWTELEPKRNLDGTSTAA